MPKDKPVSYPTQEELDERSKEIEIIQYAQQGLEQLEESPALNRLLLKNARKSANDIHAITGIDASEVAERLTILLDTGSWRDDLQEEKLILLEVGMLVDDIKTRMQRLNIDDEAWASMARVQLASLKTLMEQIDKRRKAIDGKLALVTLDQARLMGAAIKLAQEQAVFNLVKKFPELSEEIIYAEFDSEFPKAIAFLEKNASE